MNSLDVVNQNTDVSEKIGFEAQMLKGAQKLGQTWEALKELLDDCTFIFTENGLHLNSWDRNSVCLVNLMIKRISFQRYVCTQRYLLGLNMMTLYKAFKMCGKQTHVTLRIRENDPDAVYLYMANPASGLKAEVKMFSKEVDSKIMQVEETLFSRHIRMQSSQFQIMIGYLSNFATEENSDKKLLVEMFEDTLEFETGGTSSKGDSCAAKPRIILQQSNTGMSVKHGTVDAFSEEFACTEDDALQNEDGEEEDVEESVGRKRGRDNRETDVSRVKRSKANGEGESQQVVAVQSDDSTANNSAVVKGPRKKILRMHLLLKYVKYFTKAAPLCQEMRMFFEKSCLAIFSFNVGSIGLLHYCIAETVAEDASDEVLPLEDDNYNDMGEAGCFGDENVNDDDDDDNEE